MSLGHIAVGCRLTTTKVIKTINQSEGTYPGRLMK